MKQNLRIIFMGTPEFAVPTLQALIDHGENVVAVVTQPDRPKGRGRKLTPPPVKILAEKAGIPVLQPTKVRTQDFQDLLRSFSPDIFLVTAYGRILTEDVLNVPPLGCINVHGSLLPKYRGAAPIQWAILKGEQEAGITIMQMDEGMDTGDMLLTDKTNITDIDTSATLANKLSKLGGNLLIKALDKLKNNNLPPIKQDDSQATLAPLLKKEDGIIDWHKSASEISCQIRGLDPWPLATSSLSGKRVRLFSPEVISETSNKTPGTVIQANKNGLLISTGKNMILIKDIQKDGSKRMTVESFLLGHQIDVGEKLG